MPSAERRQLLLAGPVALFAALFASRSVFNFLTFANLIDIDIDREAAARYGISVEDITA